MYDVAAPPRMGRRASPAAEADAASVDAEADAASVDAEADAASVDAEADAASVDAALVDAARLDPTAFEPLYARYRDRIYAYLRTRTRTRTRGADDAADLTQQVFLQVLDALPRYRADRGSFAAWLFRIAHNAASSQTRRRRNTIAWDAVPEALQPLAPDDPETAALQQETSDRLRMILLGYAPATREMLALRFAGGLTSAEIGAVVGKSEAAVKKHLTRTLHSLKEHYRE